jgi:glycine hydroxymethyltransferase
MSLNSGGHLTHGAKPNQSGKWFNAVQFDVCKHDGRIDYDAASNLACETMPKLIVAGGSAYARHIDFERFREIADAIGAYFMVDMAHFAGLVAGGVHPSPVPIADVVTFTTHKTLRGPRGGAIVTNSEEIAKKVDSAIFPGIQGGPLMHVIAAKAVAFGEALKPSFKSYARAVVENAEVLASTLSAGGLDIVTGGTDTHVVLVDLRPVKLTGKDAEAAMERSGLTCNKNAVPYDPEKPTITSGVRLGSPAATSRGFGQAEFKRVGELIIQVLRGLAERPDEQDATEAEVRSRVAELCQRFPIYPNL